MVFYHQKRIETSYIPNLRASFKAYDDVLRGYATNIPENNSVSGTTLSVLRNLLFDGDIDGTSILEKYAKLVIASYNARRTRDIEKVLYSSSIATSKSKSLWENICLIARLRVAFQTFKDIALTLPSFEQVTIVLVRCPTASGLPSPRLLSLKEAFSVLQLDLTTATIKAVLDQKCTVDQIERKFAKRQKEKRNVHAEVQMLMFLNTDESSTSGLFPYFGCSKLSCFMCDRFIQSYGRFTTRGCHGHLYNWTVPIVDGLLPSKADRTAKALVSVQKAVKNQLTASVKGPIRHERTSVIGGSSILDGRQEERSQRQLQIARLSMIAERDRAAEMFKR